LKQEKINKAHEIKAIREKEARNKARDEGREKEDAEYEAAYQDAKAIRQGEKETWNTVPGKSLWRRNGGRKSKKLSRKNKRKTLRKKRKSNK